MRKPKQTHSFANLGAAPIKQGRPPHADDAAVDSFFYEMKEKLAKKRDEGRGGWENKAECSEVFLSQLLREHVEKGDPIDVANFCMMLSQRGERISPAPQTNVVACPCTTFEQSENCPVGYPSMICSACDGRGIAPVDKVVALAAEMMKVAEQVDELEDPFAAWETIDLVHSQNDQFRKALKWIVDHPAESNAVVWDVASNVLDANAEASGDGR
ncbi:hypothetical protein ASD52_06485 [Ensifer sp. Root142]|uniref:hypothetical protein n=1 Tax=Ensifer sp. Root142 TaxID=1736461 RepID=UPI000710B4FB|nr:hypothetical protein [Ensifer sp. Root142]KQY71327.1 hypothetical protein ASD52_06485 [Ensifer sp. Root142]